MSYIVYQEILLSHTPLKSKVSTKIIMRILFFVFQNIIFHPMKKIASEDD